MLRSASSLVRTVRTASRARSALPALSRVSSVNISGLSIAGQNSKPHNSTLASHVRTFANFTEKVPGLGDSITEGSVIEWTKKVGDYVNVDEEYVVLETDKVSVALIATKAGRIVQQLANVGETVVVGANIVILDTDAAPGAAAAPTTPAPAPAVSTTKTVAAPSVAAPSVVPSAPAPAPPSPAAPAPPKPSTPKPSPVPTPPAGSRQERTVPLSRMRLTIAKRLKSAQNTAAMLTTFNEIDMHNLMQLRGKYKEEFEAKYGAKLGFMSAFVKASANALMAAPAVNALFDEENKQIVYRDYVDIGVAVGTPTGLVVPVVRNCESLSFNQVEKAIADYGKKAKAGKIVLDDMTGGTFTISNGGVYGSLFGTPILNPPMSAILGMHGIFKRPIAINDEVVIRPMMYVALTYDHRIIDGQDAVLFLKSIKNQIENPERMLLDL